MKRTFVLPRARKEGLVIHELDDETVVYDLTTDEAHCLNQSAALVWKGCDGKTTVAGMVSVLKKKLSSSADADIVLLAVKQLQRFHLVESSKELTPAARPVSRRELVLKYAPAALALPVIMSISAPTPAQSASCAPPAPQGCPCSSEGDCQSSNCNGGTCGPELKPKPE